MAEKYTYEALQKGVVEGTFGPIEVLKGWRQAEVIKYTTDCYDVGYTTCMFVVMNLDKWRALPPDIQRIFEEVSTDWIDVHGKAWNDLDAEGRSYTLSLGNDIIPLSAEQQQLWRSAVRTVIDEYVVDAEKKGLDGKKYVDLLFDLIKKHSAR